MQGQPQPVAAQLPETGSTQWSVTLDISNTLNLESNNNENLRMDFEAYNLRFNGLYGLSENWALKIELPFIHYGSGFLDSAIDNWHNFFGLPRAQRPLVNDNQFQIFYEKNGQILLDFNSSQSSIGDIQIALGRSLIQNSDAQLSLWFSADLPSGDANKLTGNNGSDTSIWLAGNYRFHPKWRIDSNVGFLFPSNEQTLNMAIEDQVIFTYVGIQWQAYEKISLRIQLNAHSAFYSDSNLALLGAAYNMVFGGRIHINACSEIDLAFSEDVQVDATPDISFLFSWRNQINCH